VSIEAVRRRLGHASTETTQLYALLDDKVADAEIRAARPDGTGQLADRPCAEQAQRNRVYLVTAVLPTPRVRLRPGYQRWKSPASWSLRTRVRICSSRWAPRGVRSPGFRRLREAGEE
jgi:hypothetical protein